MTDALQRANRLAIEGARGEAALIMAEAAREDSGRDAIPSLSFLVSEGLKEEVLERCWKHLGGWRSLCDFEDAIEADGFPRLALLIEIGLKIDRARARRFVEEVYIPHMKREEILRGAPGRSLFFWHVPKCGGTALNNCLAAAFYRSRTAKLPSYTSRGFLNLLLSEYTSDFPYLVSAHVLRHRLELPATDRIYQILSVRDPVDRAISAWRQYFSALKRRRSILPQHGTAWNYWPQARLAEWAERAPTEVVNRQTATFSPRCHPGEALAGIRNLDRVFDVSGMADAVRRMARDLDLPLELGLLDTPKNVTDKSIPYEPEEVEILQRYLAPDLELFRRLWWPR